MSHFDQFCPVDGHYLFPDLFEEVHDSWPWTGMQKAKVGKQSGVHQNAPVLFTMMGKHLSASSAGGGGLQRPVVPPPTTSSSSATVVSVDPTPSTRRIKILPMQSNLSLADNSDTDADSGSDNDGGEDGDESKPSQVDPGDWKTPLSPAVDMPEINDRESFLSLVLEKRMASVVHQNLLTLVSFLALDAIYFGCNFPSSSIVKKRVSRYLPSSTSFRNGSVLHILLSGVAPKTNSPT